MLPSRTPHLCLSIAALLAGGIAGSAACSTDEPAETAVAAGAGAGGGGGNAGAGAAAGCVPPTAISDLSSAKTIAPTLGDLCLVAPSGGGSVIPLGTSLPYDLVSPLFSDYLLKTRTVFLPPGTSATYSADGVFAFPVGTMLTKTFAYAEDLRVPNERRHLVETRVLLKTESDWLSLPYLWNEEGTVATLSVGGTVKPLSFLGEDGAQISLGYLVPNKNQCIKCHEDLGKTELIGPKARNLNRDFAYADGTENQLSRWTKRGILVGAPAPAEAPRLAAWDDPHESVERRARSWVEINCAHCHSERGAGRTSGLYLWAHETDGARFGVCKPPVAAGAGAGTFSFDIVPGKPEESILVYRLRSTDPAVMMPELGRAVVHEAGAKLVEEWIRGLEGSCAGPK